VLFAGMIFLAAWYWNGHSAWITGGIIGASFCYAFLMLALALWTMRRQRQIGLEEAAMPCDAIPSRVSFYEYRSRWTLLGWPLVHIRFGGDPGSRQPAKGWIACGNAACGILFACGGAAVGGVAIGGCALGLLSCGGISVGIFAIGGVVLGYLGCGGAAVAWQAACGGAAVARNFAVGGTAMAQHVNDGTARAFMQNSLFFSHAFQIMDFAVLLNCLLLVPGVLYWRKQLRQEQAGR
jgi:hypothetical protein